MHQLTNSNVSQNLCVHVSFSSALDSRTGAKVAIKKLYRPFQSDIFAKRAYRELRLLKHMKHENVSHHTDSCSINVYYYKDVIWTF